MSIWRHRSLHPVRWAGETARRLCRVFNDRSGNVMIIAAFSIIPLIGAVGIATDTARAYLVKSRLQSAVDSAALAGGRVFSSTSRDSDIRQYFDANFPQGYMNAAITPLQITPDANNETVNLSASATIPTTFMKLLGSQAITVAAAAEVTRQISRLHVVLALDMSGSMTTTMENGNTRIENAKAAATTLTNILFGSNATNDLLKVGVVPWAGKVNVTYDGSRYGYDSDGSGGWVPHSGALYTTEAVSYTNPYPSISAKYPYQTYSSSSAHLWKYASPNGGLARSAVYVAHNSPVPLFDPPPTGWTGCVYARFTGDDTTSADTQLGPQTVNGVDWVAWEPMSMPRATSATLTAPYNVSAGDGMLTGGTFGVAQASASAGSSVVASLSGTFALSKGTTGVCTRYRWDGSCRTWSYPNWSAGTVLYWDDSSKVLTDSSSGNTRIGVAASDAATGDSTAQVTLDENVTGDPQSGSNNNSNEAPNSVCLDTHAERNSTNASYRTSDCTPCPQNGITPLTSTKADVTSAITALTIPAIYDTDYYTNIPQGLAWAWEVLMPDSPFTEGTLADPTQTVPRAIVLMTDGFNTCRQGDAYQDYYDPADGCSTWRDKRVKAIADNIKATPDVYIYTIQYASCDASTAALLKTVATKDTAPYYYCAPTAAELESAFTEIGDQLSNLRLSR